MDESSIQLLRAALGTELGAPGVDQDPREFWLKAIANRMAWVMDHQFGQLPQVLYRLDVPEAQVNAVFDKAERSDEIPDLLAELVLTRMEEVARNRAAYDTSGTD